MRVLDEMTLAEVAAPDLAKGELRDAIIAPPEAYAAAEKAGLSALPDDAYERVQLYHVWSEQEIYERRKAQEEAKEQMKYSQQMNAAALLFIRSSAKTLTDEHALTVSLLFEEWSDNSHYEKDAIRQYKGNIYRCLQEHDSQESWTPDVAHSQWVRIRPEGEILEWEPVQPGVNEAYKKGDKVKHNGKIWVSGIDNNTWEPGVYGWEIVE